MNFFQMAQAISPFLLLAIFIFFYRLNQLEARVYRDEREIQRLKQQLKVPASEQDDATKGGEDA